MNTVELLDLAKARHNVSDYGLSKLLGVGPSTVGNYRGGRSHPDDRMARKLAELANLDPLQVTAWMQAERSRDAESRATWRAIAERLAATAAGVCMSVCITGGPDAHASALAADASPTPGQPVYYVNRLLRLMRRAFAALTKINPAPTGLALA